LALTYLFSIALQHCTSGKTRPWLRTNRGFGVFLVRRWCVGKKDLALYRSGRLPVQRLPLAECPGYPYLALNGDVDA
jgi:hypothetical protein